MLAGTSKARYCQEEGERRPCGRRGFDGVRGEWTGGGEAVDDAGGHDFRRFLGSSQHYLLLLSLHDLGKLPQMPCSFAQTHHVVTRGPRDALLRLWELRYFLARMHCSLFRSPRALK